MNIALDPELNFHQRSLNVRAQRQQLIASNIANADTPNYKARDMDFRTALNSAMGGGSLSMAATRSGHIQGGAEGMSPFAMYRNTDQGSVDGNTVDMDTERSAFAENSVQYEASLTFINDMIRTMRLAITGQ